MVQTYDTADVCWKRNNNKRNINICLTAISNLQKMNTHTHGYVSVCCIIGLAGGGREGGGGGY